MTHSQVFLFLVTIDKFSNLSILSNSSSLDFKPFFLNYLAFSFGNKSIGVDTRKEPAALLLQKAVRSQWPQ